MDVFSLMGKIAIDYEDSVKALETVSKQSSSTKSDLKDVGDAATDTGDNLDDLGDAASGASGDLSDVGNAAEDASDGIGSAGDAADDAGNGLDELGDAASDAYDSFDGLGDAAYDASSGLDDVGNSGSGASSGIDAAGDSADSAGNDMDQLGDAASGACSGLDDLGSSADGADDSLSTLDVTMGNLVSSGITSLASSLGNVITSTVSSGDEIDKMSQKIGISTDAYQEWAYVFELCGTDVSNLQTGMKTLSGVIVDAADGSDTAAEKLAAVGLSVDDLNGLSQEEQFELVVAALQNMESGAERTTAATDLLGKSATDMAAVFNTSSEQTDALRQQAHDLGIVLDEETISSSAELNDAWTTLKDSASGMGARLATDFLPKLTELCDKITEDVIPAVESFVGWLDKMSPILLPIAAGIGAIVAAYTTYKTVTTAVTTAQTLLNAVMNANPFVLIVTLIVGLVAALVTLWNTNEGFREAVTVAWEAIKETFSTIIEAIVGFFEGLPETISNIWETLKTTVSNAIESVSTTISNVLATIKTTFSNIWNSIVTTVTNIWNKLKTTVSNAINNVKTTVSNVLTSIKTTFSNIWNSIKTTVSNVFTSVKTTITNGMNSAKTAVTNVLDGIKTKFTNAFDKVKTTVSNAIDKIKGFFKFDVSLPNIKLPHFGITPEGWQIGDLLQGSIPKLGIEWYAKAMDDGMVMTEPTVFGYNASNGSLLAGGEAGSETVVGTESLMTMIQAAVGNRDSALLAALEEILSLLKEYFKSDNGDIIIPVYIGNEKIDELIIDAKQRQAKRSGGMSYA